MINYNEYIYENNNDINNNNNINIMNNKKNKYIIHINNKYNNYRLINIYIYRAYDKFGIYLKYMHEYNLPPI